MWSQKNSLVGDVNFGALLLVAQALLVPESHPALANQLLAGIEFEFAIKSLLKILESVFWDFDLCIIAPANNRKGRF